MGSHLIDKPMARAVRPDPRFSLMFRRGQRPSAADVVKLANSRQGTDGEAGKAPGFAVSYQPEAADWLELLAGGMTFDLAGLAPAMAAPMPVMAHFYGFTKTVAVPAEAITLNPGDQWRDTANSLPVVRAMAGLAARLAGLAGATGVVWHPARCAMLPDAFAAAIAGWRAGGAFPALGLTALFCDEDGAICSEGLAFFIGQELWIDPLLGKNTTVNAHIATRLINQLVGSQPIHQPFETTGPNGEQLSVVPSGNDGFLRVWRKT